MGKSENNIYRTSAPGIIRNALKHAPVPMAVLEGFDLVLTYANQALFNVWGKDKSIVGKELLKILPELKDQPFPNLLRQVLLTGEVYEEDEAPSYVIKNGKRETIYFDYSYTPIKDDEGVVIGVLIVANDVTDRVLARLKLQESETRFSNLVSEFPVPMAVFAGEDFTISLANKAALTLWGKTEKVIGLPVIQALPELKGQDYINILKQVYQSGEAHQGNEELVYLQSGEKLESKFINYIYQPVQRPGATIKEILAIGHDVTEQVKSRHQSEKNSLEIMQAHKNLEMALDAGRMGYFELELSSGVISCTPQFKINYGLAIDVPLDKGMIFNVILPKYHNYINEQLTYALENKTVYTVRYEVEWPDKSLHWIKATGYALYNDSGEPVSLCGVTLDITSEVQADEKKAILASIIDSSDDTILSKTLQGIITSWNPAAQRMFGYTEDEVIGKHISILIPKRLLFEEDEIIGNIRKGNKIDHFETTRVTKDGREINIVLSVSPIRDSFGNIIGASKIARDITDTKTVHEKQATLAAIVNSSDDTILSKTLQGIITSWNPAAERMFGYTEQEVIGKHISILIPPELLFEEEMIIGNIARGNKVDHFETVRVTKDGRRIHISLSVSPIRDSNGIIIGASKIARDITQQKLAERRLRSYAHTLEVINELCKTISEELEAEKLLQIVIDAAARVTGATLGMFFYDAPASNGEISHLRSFSGSGLQVYDQLQKEGKADDLARLAVCSEGILIDDIRTSPLRNWANCEEPLKAIGMRSYLLMPVLSKTGETVGSLLLARPDVSKFSREHEEIILAIASQASIALENSRLFEQVKVLNRKKDEFIGMASHELKTPLTSMSGYLQILERVQKEEKHKNFVQKTIAQANKLSALVNDILDVSKIEAGKLQFLFQKFDIIALLQECVELIQLSSTKHHISIHSELQAVYVDGDRHRIEQVIINLLTNAIKYSPEAFNVEILLQESSDEVRVGVKDSGIGIAKDKVQHLFSRFYRVEGLNPGMTGLGIGLYISREIIDRHSGKIWVETEEGKGSTFWFSLPKYK